MAFDDHGQTDRQASRVMEPLTEARSLTELAADHIRAAILDGVFQPGDRLSDFHLAQSLGISRGPVREALRLLAADSLVVQTTNKGAFVSEISRKDLKDIYELRSAVESCAARTLAKRHAASDVRALDGLLQQMLHSADNGDAEAVTALDLEFHETLCRLTGNRRLQAVFEREVPLIVSLARFDRTSYQPLTEMTEELVPLVRAIEEGDAGRASDLIERHICRAGEAAAGQMPTGSSLQEGS